MNQLPVPVIALLIFPHLKLKECLVSSCVDKNWKSYVTRFLKNEDKELCSLFPGKSELDYPFLLLDNRLSDRYLPFYFCHVSIADFLEVIMLDLMQCIQDNCTSSSCSLFLELQQDLDQRSLLLPFRLSSIRLLRLQTWWPSCRFSSSWTPHQIYERLQTFEMQVSKQIRQQNQIEMELRGWIPNCDNFDNFDIPSLPTIGGSLFHSDKNIKVRYQSCWIESTRKVEITFAFPYHYKYKYLLRKNK